MITCLKIVALTKVEMIVPSIASVQDAEIVKTILTAIHKGGITAVIILKVKSIAHHVVKRKAFKTTAGIMCKY